MTYFRDRDFFQHFYTSFFKDGFKNSLRTFFRISLGVSTKVPPSKNTVWDSSRNFLRAFFRNSYQDSSRNCLRVSFRNFFYGLIILKQFSREFILCSRRASEWKSSLSLQRNPSKRLFQWISLRHYLLQEIRMAFFHTFFIKLLQGFLEESLDRVLKIQDQDCLMEFQELHKTWEQFYSLE